MNLQRMIPATAVIALFFSNILLGQNTPAINAFAAKASTLVANDSIRPFHIKVPSEALAELHRRLAATRWPDQETDPSQGAQLATMKELVRYWDTTYDWRKAEARLNALPEFVATIDGVDIQFVHIRSRNPNAMPLIMTHGWPGEIYNAPRSWAEQSYHKLIYFHKVDKGGHFAAWEQPELFADEIRAAFRPLR